MITNLVWKDPLIKENSVGIIIGIANNHLISLKSLLEVCATISAMIASRKELLTLSNQLMAIAS